MKDARTVTLAGGLAVLVALLAAIALIAAAHHWTGSTATLTASPYKGSMPPPGLHLPSFALPRIGGGTVATQSGRGRIVLTTFVDSACKESCPIIAGTVGRSLRLLRPSERKAVLPLAFSVNLRVDSAQHVRRFLARQRASMLVYLVAPDARMRPVWKSFGIVPAVDTGDSDVHSANVRVFDRRGVWVSTLHVGVDLTPGNLAHDIREALRNS